MPKKVMLDSMRKKLLTVSIPKALMDKLESIPNRSRIITQILEDNAEMILSGDVERARKFRENALREEILRLIYENRFEIASVLIDDSDIKAMISKLGEIREEAKALKDEARQLQKEVEIIISELKTTRREVKKGIVNDIEAVIGKFRENLLV